MADTNIEWTEKVWNPIRGCSRVSAGCMNCYAERQAIRQIKTGYVGLIKRTSHGPAWTGEVRFVTELVDQPLRWMKPRRIFVNSMSDLFHEGVTDAELDRMFAVMALAQRHTFQCLTKRPERMARYVNELTYERLIRACNQSADGGPHRPGAYNLTSIEGRSMRARFVAGERNAYAPLQRWPLPNVWLGVSVEDQATADERIPLLLQTPAAVRFVSYEPALAAVDFTNIAPPDLGDGNQYAGLNVLTSHNITLRPRIDWLIVGGESGPGARPCDIAWIRSAVEQCKAAGVPVFVKQTGSQIRVPRSDAIEFAMLGSWTAEGPGAPFGIARPADRKGGDMQEWPADLRVREFPA